MLRSSLLLSVLSFAVSLVSFINQLVIARFFGASAHMDAYLVAISLPYLLMGLAAGVFSFSLVPVQVRLRSDPERYARFSGLLLICLALGGVVLVLLAWVFAPALITLVAPSASGAVQAEAIPMARISWLTFGCALVTSYFVSMQNAARRFVAPVLSSVLPCAGMIGFGLALIHSLGPLAVVYGGLAGYAVSLALLYVLVSHEVNLNIRANVPWREVTSVLAPMPLVVLSMLCFTVYGSVDAFWATRLGASNLSYLGYAQRLLIALGNVVTLGPITVILPHLSEAAAQGRVEQFRTDTLRALRMILAFASLAGLMASILSIPSIELLFERGAFDHAATLGTAAILPGMYLGMVAMLSVVLLFRALYARRDVTGAAWLGALATGLYFGLSGLLSRHLQLQGIVAAYVITWWVTLGMTFLRVWGPDWRTVLNLENLAFAGQLLAALVIVGGISLLGCALWLRPLSALGWAGLAWRTAVLGALGTAVFLLLTTVVFRMPEAMALVRLLPLRHWQEQVTRGLHVREG